MLIKWFGRIKLIEPNPTVRLDNQVCKMVRIDETDQTDSILQGLFKW